MRPGGEDRIERSSTVPELDNPEWPDADFELYMNPFSLFPLCLLQNTTHPFHYVSVNWSLVIFDMAKLCLVSRLMEEERI